jgi:phosphate transport system substrate-binding protein
MSRLFQFLTISAILLTGSLSKAQDQQTSANARQQVPLIGNTPQKVVVITGARFSYKLIEKWIDEYNKTNPSVQIVVESRGSADPLKYDILAEVYEHDEDFKAKREYINVGRYAVFPVATSSSSFAKTYGTEGLTKQHIVQIFFHDLFADKEKQKTIKAPYTVYTRLQKAGVPLIFSKYFGFEQKDIQGNGIAGADTHLVKALLKDSTAVSYLPTAVIFGDGGNQPIKGLTVIPVDANGNNKISDDEKFVNSFTSVVEKLETAAPGDVKNIPIDYLHLSVDKQTASAEAIDFLKWVNDNGQKYLHDFGFFLPESKKFEKEKFNEFASRKGK